ncbi:MAG: hypothetical protein RLZZ297_1967 [Chloroflexota bacterium]|jgi:broad specificity phosphatase PhoE
MNVVLIRHGETSYNATGLMYGHADVGLNDRGRAQAAATGARLRTHPVTALYASDLSRAVHTAQAVAGHHGLPVHREVGLREQHVGDWEHLTIPQVVERFPTDYHAYMADPAHTPYTNGESFAMLQSRALRAYDAIIARHGDGDTIYLVCHGGTINALVCGILGLDIREHQKLWVENCSLTTFRRQGGIMRMMGFNDVTHLATNEALS